MYFYGTNQLSKEATILRLGPYVGGKATYSAGTPVRGFLEPIATDQSVIALGIEGQAYRFVVNGNIDARVGDRLSIDSIEYRVRGIQPFEIGGINNRELTLELSVKL